MPKNESIYQYFSRLGRKGARKRWDKDTSTKEERSERMKRVRRGEKIKASDQAGQ